MSLHQRDYILRLIERITAVLARILKRRNEGDLEGARADLAAATAELLGTSGPLLPLVDARTAVDLLSDGERVILYARLLVAESTLSDDARPMEKARALLTELRRRAAPLSDASEQFVRELLESHVP
jgi:hypothetical protein